MTCGTVSKAFAKSRYSTFNSLVASRSLYWKYWSRKVIKRSLADRCFLKPYWLRCNVLSKKKLILSKISFSKVLRNSKGDSLADSMSHQPYCLLWINSIRSSWFISHKILPICFSLQVSLFKFSSVFVVVTCSHLLYTEMKYRLNSSAFSLSTDVSSSFNFTVGGIKPVFLVHFRYFCILQNFFSSKPISQNLISYCYSTVWFVFLAFSL